MKQQPAPYDPKRVGRRLTIIRSAAGLSQTTFAKSVGASPQHVGNWEHGRSAPSFQYAIKIREVYGVTLDYLYLGRDDTLQHGVRSSLVSAAPGGEIK